MNRFLGGLVLGVGILIMTCSGLCSLVVIVMGFGAVIHEPSVLILPLIFGGLPFAIGFATVRWGRSILRRADDQEY